MRTADTLKEKLEEMKMSNWKFALRTSKPEETIIAVLKGEISLTVGTVSPIFSENECDIIYVDAICHNHNT